MRPWLKIGSPVYTEQGRPWTVTEDRKLLTRVLAAKSKAKDSSYWVKIANELGRSMTAVQNRFYSLQSGMRLKAGEEKL